MAKKKKKTASWKTQIFIIMILLLMALFHAMAIIAIIGMIPTIVAAIVDRTKGRIRTLTVGAINFAGCAPFMIYVFKQGNTMQTAVGYILKPETIVVMYFAACMGYVIDWAMTGIVSSIMVQRAKKRLKDISKLQKELIERWGAEVTGTIPLDQYGFPTEASPAKAQDE